MGRYAPARLQEQNVLYWYLRDQNELSQTYCQAELFCLRMVRFRCKVGDLSLLKIPLSLKNYILW